MKLSEDNKKLYIIIIMLCILLVGFIIYQQIINYKLNSENMIIPNNLKGLIYSTEGRIVFLKMDLTKSNHQNLLSRITEYCKYYQMTECSGLLT